MEILSDPLSDITRKERRNLLLASTVGVYVSWTGLVPTQIATLGIVLSINEQRNFLVLLSIVILYFLVAFITYGVADYFIYREKRRNYEVGVESEILQYAGSGPPHPEDPEEVVPHIAWVYRWSKGLARVRLLVEYGVPVSLCVTSIAMLLFFTQIQE